MSIKYAVLIGDGMADWPIKEFDGKTLLEYSKTPNLDFLANQGSLGLAKTIPDNFEPGSDIATLSILGCNPEKYYSGRAPLEAVSLGINLSDSDIAFRCNLVTVEGTKLADYCAGHITTKEANEIIGFLKNNLDDETKEFFTGVSYRHILRYKNAPKEWQSKQLKTTPPHDFTGKDFLEFLPKGNSSEILIDVMKKSFDILKNCPTNINRIRAGKNPANMIWLWGQGALIDLPKFEDVWKKTGSVISAVDLVQDIGKSAGLNVIKVNGATGYIDTNYQGKVDAALTSLETEDFVLLHVEAPDEAGHSGNRAIKQQAIEDFDKKIVGPIIEGLKKFKDFRILVMPDHATPVEIKTHSREAVPFAIYPPLKKNKEDNLCFCEKDALNGAYKIDQGHKLLTLFITGK